MKTNGAILAAGVLLGTLPLGAGDGFGQPTTEADTGLSPTEEIIVTARRREEKLQDVPISITALTGAQLEQRNITRVEDLQTAVPSLSITTTGGSFRETISFAMRGQSTREPAVLTDPPVGTYFAEVVQPRTYGFGYALYDIQNVQVLKGVQGTLFGRNVTAGAVLFEPQHPKSEWEAELKGEAGNYGMWSTYGMINVPLVDNKLALRVNGIIKQRNGYTINSRTGRDYDNLDYWSGRSSLLFSPTDNIESLVVFDILKSRTNGSGTVLTYLRQAPDARGGSMPVAGNTAVLGASGVANLAAAFQQQLALGPRRVVGSPYDFNTVKSPFPNQHEYTTLWNYGITNKTTIDLGHLTIRNIFGYRHIDYRRLSDFYHVPLVLISPNNGDRYGIYSEEFQLQGHAFDDRLDWTTGVFGFLERGDEFAHSIQFAEAAPVPSIRGNERFVRANAISYAIFGAGTFTMTDHWKVSGGLRWNHDQRSVRTTHHLRAGTPPSPTCAHTGVVQTVVPVNTCILTNGNAWRAVTWDISLNYEPTPDTTLYAAQRKGFRSGGFGVRSTSQDTLQPFAPEFTNETEFGAKKLWSLGDASLSTNVALFYQKLTNVQVQLPQNVGGTLQTITVNTGAQKNYGGELEVALNLPLGPSGGVDMSGFYSFVNVADTINRPFNALIGVPKHQLGYSANYTFPFDESVGTVTLGGDISYRSHMHLDEFDPPAGQDGYALANFHLNWDEIYGTGLGLGLFVSNAFDRIYKVGGSAVDDVSAPNGPGPANGQTGANVGLISSMYGEPRMWGGSIKYKF